MSSVCIFLGSSVPIEIGEMDGRNAGSAVIGFVNGMYIIKYHSRRFPKKNLFLYTNYIILFLSFHSEKEKSKTKKRTQKHLKKNFGMTQRNGTHDNIGMK